MANILVLNRMEIPALKENAVLLNIETSLDSKQTQENFQNRETLEEEKRDAIDMITGICLAGDMTMLNYHISCCLELDDCLISECLHRLPKTFEKYEIIEFLLSNVKNMNYPYCVFSFLHFACIFDRPLCVRHLLECGADLNALDTQSGGHDALYIASTYGCLDIVKVLCEWVGNVKIPEIRFNIALRTACASGHAEVVRYLINTGVDVNGFNKTGLLSIAYATMHDYPDIVELLLEKGANANAGLYSVCLLIYACQRGLESIVKVLLKYGADPNTIDYQGRSSLYHTRSIPIMQLLFDHGADPDLIALDGFSVLYHTVASVCQGNKCANIELIIVLLDHGANINLANAHTGETPLMVAATTGHIDLVRLLLERGADVTQLNHAGKCVLDMLGWSWTSLKISYICRQYIDSNKSAPYEQPDILLK